MENWLRIWQKRLEYLDAAAVKKQESFLDGQELVKSEDEINLVEVEHWHLNDEACEDAISTNTEDCADVLSQVEELQQEYQFDEINAVKNSPQVKCKMQKSIEMERVHVSSVSKKQKYQEGMK